MEKTSLKWAADVAGPWSLPYLLMRNYVRFKEAAFPELIHVEKSVSGQRSLLELPDPDSVREQMHLITNPILDAFASLTHRLPTSMRLSYQLFLEGLLNFEIAQILAITEAEVESAIRDAKVQLEVAVRGTGT